MSAFILTPKVNIPLNGGMKIEKGQTFIVNLPCLLYTSPSPRD